MKKSTLLKFFITSVILVFVLSCNTGKPPSSSIETTIMHLDDVCTGSIAEACSYYGTSENACNGLSAIDCQWVSGECIPETDCSTLSEYGCNLAANSTPPIQSCTWGPPPQNVCTGSIAEACSYYGTTETACNGCTAIDCQWVSGECIPETDCNGLLTEYDCDLAANGTDPIASCTWGPPTCTGSIAEACSYYGTTETACNGLSAIDCQWVSGECIPETDCTLLDDYHCHLAIYGADPIPSCTWGPV